ncbi:MAG TPA: RNA 3'-terminal phosphate cyclase, partial [Candidatus Sulfotelmatobacter sp.]|nr:RNA 3'-terminal phosphate cyclase [Candidatus Sulfotelmatobacter sp.]
MIIIDGSQGEGGGQILRTALALSLVTGQPFRLERVRAGRQKPGLLRQHLTAVEAAKTIGCAEVVGAALGAQTLEFRPGPVTPGNYRFAVGTAGSATLVLQTVLPPLLIASGTSTLTLEGGTHNPFAPPFDFLARCFAPLLERMGPRLELELRQPGF